MTEYSEEALTLEDIIKGIKQVGHVRHFKQTDLSLFDDVQNIKQPESIHFFEKINDYDVIHFSAKLQPNKRSNFALEGYFIKALARKYELTNNSAVRQWIEAQVINTGGLETNSKITVTTQVKRLIVESIAQ